MMFLELARPKALEGIDTVGATSMVEQAGGNEPTHV